MKYVDIRDLPPCAFSPQCLRLVDDLDMPPEASPPARMAYIEDLQDERKLRQIRSHLLSCPTCSAVLTEARHMRTQQRMMLYHFLLANERQVPSTSGAIFEAIQHEKASGEKNASQQASSHAQILTIFPRTIREEATPKTERTSLHARAPHRHNFFQNLLTLATVAAVILAAAGLLNRFSASNRPAQSPGSQPPEQHSALDSYGWNSVLVGLTVLTASGIVRGFTFYTYYTTGDQLTELMSSQQELVNMDMEGISQDGQSLLYDVTLPDQQKTYATFSPSTGPHNFYQLNAGTGGNAIWMDASHILVQNIEGKVLELEAATKTLQHSWSIKTGRLMFYHQPFLYFTGAQESVLYRVNLVEANATPQRITGFVPDTRFWLSKDGSTLFYSNKGPENIQGIYALDSDGSHLRLLHRGPGIPIGYAEDNALMLLAQAGHEVQVIQLGATSTEQPRVVFPNAAPGATSLCGPENVAAIIPLCDQSVALAPDGHDLLLHAYYPDGTNSLVYDNLITGTSRTILNLPDNAHVQLPGWSRMSINSVTPTAPASLSDEAILMCA